MCTHMLAQRWRTLDEVFTLNYIIHLCLRPLCTRLDSKQYCCLRKTEKNAIKQILSIEVLDFLYSAVCVQTHRNQLSKNWSAVVCSHHTCVLKECRGDPLTSFGPLKPLNPSVVMLTLPSYKNSHPLTTIAHCEKQETSEFATSVVALLLKEKSRDFHNM